MADVFSIFLQVVLKILKNCLPSVFLHLQRMSWIGVKSFGYKIRISFLPKIDFCHSSVIKCVDNVPQRLNFVISSFEIEAGTSAFCFHPEEGVAPKVSFGASFTRTWTFCAIRNVKLVKMIFEHFSTEGHNKTIKCPSDEDNIILSARSRFSVL